MLEQPEIPPADSTAPVSDKANGRETTDNPLGLPTDAAGKPLANSAGQPFTNVPGGIWTVEDYYRAKELYDKHGAVFNPALEMGSPAAHHVLAQLHFRATAPEAQTFGDVFGDLRVKPNNADSELWRAYSDILVACDAIGGDQKEALRKMRAKVCQHHSVDFLRANTMPLPQFVALWHSANNAGSPPPLANTTDGLPEFILNRLRVNDSVVTAEEVAHWPDGILNRLLKSGALVPAENAKSAVCDACGHDHVEEVVYVESPPGSGLRAYIPCPEVGRVQVSLDRLRRWVVDRSGFPAQELAPTAIHGDTDEEAHPTSAVEPIGNRGAQKQPAQRSWTQVDLDQAIRKYKAERASTYGDLVAGVRLGKAGAKRSARNLYGRNAIARALRVKAAAMVSNSPVWQAIADELKLRGSPKARGPSLQQRVGIEIAIEEKAMSTGEGVVDQVIRDETICLVKKAMPKVEAEATIEKLTRGEISDDRARELIEAFGEQRRDDRTRNVRQVP